MSKVKREKPRSTIDELRAELASRRERVARCEQELAAAKTDVDQYVAKIAEALGLPNPVAREAKRIEKLKLQKRGHELSEEGKTIHEIAVDAKVKEPATMAAQGPRSCDGCARLQSFPHRVDDNGYAEA